MRFLTGFLVVLGIWGTALPAFCAEDISVAARRISANKEKMEQLNKESLKTGQSVADIGELSIDDFLELEAVPDGLDAASADSLYQADQSFNFMTPNQAIAAIKVMRQNGIQLPQDLEKNIQKDPDNASKLMNEAFAAIPPADIEGKEDITAVRRNLIRQSENALGISFKSLVESQKKMMTTVKKKK